MQQIGYLVGLDELLEGVGNALHGTATLSANKKQMRMTKILTLKIDHELWSDFLK